MSFSNAANTYSPHVAAGPATAQTGVLDGGVWSQEYKKKTTHQSESVRFDKVVIFQHATQPHPHLGRWQLERAQFTISSKSPQCCCSQQPPAAGGRSTVRCCQAHLLEVVSQQTDQKKAQQNSKRTEIAQLSFKLLLPFDSNQVCWVHSYRKTSNN